MRRHFIISIIGQKSTHPCPSETLAKYGVFQRAILYAWRKGFAAYKIACSFRATQESRLAPSKEGISDLFQGHAVRTKRSPGRAPLCGAEALREPPYQ